MSKMQRDNTQEWKNSDFIKSALNMCPRIFSMTHARNIQLELKKDVNIYTPSKKPLLLPNTHHRSCDSRPRSSLRGLLRTTTRSGGSCSRTTSRTTPSASSSRSGPTRARGSGGSTWSGARWPGRGGGSTASRTTTTSTTSTSVSSCS